MPTSARRKHKVGTGGPWGSGLLLLGIAVTLVGVQFAAVDRSNLRAPLAWIDQVIPVPTWAALWICAGLYSVMKALTPPQRHVDLAPAVGVMCIWSAIYGLFWLTSGIVEGVWTRDWVTSVVWASFAAVLISFGRCVNPPHKRPPL